MRSDAKGTEPIRFLGWRAGVSKTSVSSASTEDGQEPGLRALWSDDAALERTDGFDFSRWWEDLAPEKLQTPPKLSKAEVVRPKAKTPRSGPDPVPELEWAKTTCPAGLLEALEALQRGEGGPAPNGAPSPSRGATRARPSPFIGARKVRPLVGAAELAALQVEDEVVVASSPLAPTQVEQEEGLRVLADLSDSELGKLCRGQVPHVQRELERQLVARAQQRKKVYEEAAQQGRRKAAHFRRRVELKLLKEAGAQGPTETGVFEPFQRRAERLNTLSTRRMSLSVARVDDEASESEKLLSAGEEARKFEEQRELSEAARNLRRRIREAALAGIREKKKHVDKMLRKRKFREVCWKAFPPQERLAIEAVFKLHCDKHHCLSSTAALDALRDIGLRGRTMIERNCVERAVSSLIRDLVRVEEEGVSGAPCAAPEGSPQIWWRSPVRESHPLPTLPTSARTRTESQLKLPVRSSGSATRGSLTGRTSVSSHRSSKSNEGSAAVKELVETFEATQNPTGIPLEAFGAEVMPSARFELFEQRTEPHFQLFVQEMEKSRNPSGISYEQFQKLLAELGLDKAKGPLPPPFKKESQRIGPGTCLDLEMVHIRLLQLEERAAREAAAKEWAVAKAAKINPQLFRQYRHELLWISDMFNAHDEEHAGFLGQFEVRRLMKYMGLEPYSRHTAPEIDRLIRDVDENHDDEIELNEFLNLLSHARRFQMKWRKVRLQRSFLRLDLDPNGCLAFDQIVAALAQDGLLRTRGEYAIAQRLLDEEFDLGSVFRSAARGEGDGSISPRSTRSMPVRRRQRLLLMDDPGSVDFQGFSIIYQRVWERLAALKGERVTQAAEALNFSLIELSDIQAAFDHYDRDSDGMLTSTQLVEALRPLLPRLPEEQQLRKLMPALEETDEDEESFVVIDIFEFMKLLRTLTAGSSLVHLNKPFSLADDVPFEKQQELMQVWPISESYIQSLDASELVEMLSNFLGVKPDQNLRDLSYPISSFRKLREFAVRQAERAQNHTRF